MDFVLNQHDFDIAVCRCLGGHKRFLLERRVGLVRVGRRLRFDDSGGRRGLDHGERGDDIAKGVADLYILSVSLPYILLDVVLNVPTQ